MKKKVLILSLEKGYSGLEKQVVTLANSLVELYDISLFFLNDTNNDLNINPKIKVIVKDNKLLSLNRDYYKNLFKDIDVLISTSDYFNKYVIKYANSKKIYWEHNALNNKSGIKYIKDFDYVVVPNMEAFNNYKKITNNAVLINTAIVLPISENTLENKNILFVGKLIKNKRIDELIKMFLMVSKQIDVSLYIVGEGPERKNLEKLVNENNLTNVYFEGIRNNEEIESIYRSCGLYVTASDTEYTASSIIEAMSYGIPVVAFSDILNINSFIIDDINGYLIGNRDIKKMCAKVVELMTNDLKRQTFGNCAREKAMDFDINSVKREWIKII